MVHFQKSSLKFDLIKAMQKLRLAFVSFTVILSLSCSHRSIESSRSETQSNGSEVSEGCLKVEFRSKGAGINRKALNDLENYIQGFQAKHNGQPAFTVKQLGKEGERKFFIKLNSLNSAENNDFISGLEQVIGTSDLTTIQRNSPCEEGSK